VSRIQRNEPATAGKTCEARLPTPAVSHPAKRTPGPAPAHRWSRSRHLFVPLPVPVARPFLPPAPPGTRRPRWAAARDQIRRCSRRICADFVPGTFCRRSSRVVTLGLRIVLEVPHPPVIHEGAPCAAAVFRPRAARRLAPPPRPTRHPVQQPVAPAAGPLRSPEFVEGPPTEAKLGAGEAAPLDPPPVQWRPASLVCQ